jgi:Na+-translocating ferredoxin:NAD+ oxidoreductase RnfC subunit
VLSQTLKEMGVVGAGGAGFPTYVKAGSEVEFVLANGAECEPLVHKDVELMTHFAPGVTAGMRAMMDSTQAQRGIFGIKEKNSGAIAALQPHLDKHSIELFKMGDFYPAGDEYELVHLATGRLIPPAGLPLHVGCVVNNVETFYNVDQASKGKPVTHKFVSITGFVNDPCSFWIPLGTTFRELIELAGGARESEFAVFVGGLMMGRLTHDLDEPVTKTTAGLILLPKSHYLVTRQETPPKIQSRIGKSACDQCSYCTELCPRYLMGYEIEPHKVMRSLVFSATGADNWNKYADLCCSCGLCTLYACPENLFPREACEKAKGDMRSAGIKHVQEREVKPHPMKEYRRVPVKLLSKRLKVEEFESEAPFREIKVAPNSVNLNLKQHVGAPATATVAPGDKVSIGDTIAKVGESDLGVNLHASINGRVESITENFIRISRS